MAETRKQAERLSAIEMSLKDIEQEIKNPTVMLEAIKKLEKTLKDFGKQLREAQDILHAVKRRQEDQDREINVIRADNLKMKKDLSELRDILEQQERDRRMSWLELTGLDLDPKSNHAEVVNLIHKACSIKVKKEEINDSYAVKNSNKSKCKLVIKYVDQELKEKVQKAIRAKKLKVGDIGLTPENQPIFANDSLSYNASNLFWQVRQAKIKQKWHGAWTAKGKILVRRESEGRTIQIKNLEELTLLLK